MNFETQPEPIFRSICLLCAGMVLGTSLAGCGLFGGGNGGGSKDTNPPPTPDGLEAASQDGAISLNWSGVQAQDLSGYNVYRSTSSIGQVENLDPINGNEVSEAGYTDQTAENGTAYHYVVTALDESGNESPPSGEVKKTPFAEPPDRP